MDTGATTAQISVSKKDFFRIIESSGAVKMSIARGEETFAKLGYYAFERSIVTSLPPYENQANGVPIYTLETVYEIKSKLRVSNKHSTSRIPASVTSHLIVDDRTTPTYTVFLSINTFLRAYDTE